MSVCFSFPSQFLNSKIRLGKKTKRKRPPQEFWVVSLSSPGFSFWRQTNYLQCQPYTKYTVWPEVYGHTTITHICGSSKCWSHQCDWSGVHILLAIKCNKLIKCSNELWIIWFCTIVIAKSVILFQSLYEDIVRSVWLPLKTTLKSPAQFQNSNVSCLISILYTKNPSLWLSLNCSL